jgi:putative tryptophan/tyrosine transport system substrate-binding protein
MTQRRWIIVALALSLFWLLLADAAQKSAKIPRVGVLEPGFPPTVTPRRCLEFFQQGLGDLGYREGQNIVLEYRYGEFKPDRLPGLAADLVQRQPDVLWTNSNRTAQMLKQATTTLPIVVGASSDLEEYGLVESLARPGGNLTGLDARTFALTSKRLELLKDAVPQITRVAVLVDSAGPFSARIPGAFEREAQALGIHLLRVEAGDPGAFDAAFAAMEEQRADALVLMDSPMFSVHSHRLAGLALAHRLPTIGGGTRALAEAGLLIIYGAYAPDLCRRSALYVDKILKGAQPADLPVEQPMKFNLVINRKTAQALGLTIPPHILFQADEVIQ